MKKIIKTLLAAFLIALPVATTTLSQPTFATDGQKTTTTGSFGSCRELFLGITSWDCGVNSDPKNESDLSNNVKRIAENVMGMILALAGYLALGFVIWGGYQYMMSSGDPGKTANAKKTLINAFIGLAITVLAKTIMGTIVGVLSPSGNLIGLGGGDVMIKNAINWFIGISGIVCVIFIVMGGFGYMTAAGDPGKIQKAKKTLTYALIGLAVVALSYVITNFVINMINSSGNPTT